MSPVFPNGLSFMRTLLSTMTVKAAVPEASGKAPAGCQAYQFPYMVVLNLP